MNRKQKLIEKFLENPCWIKFWDIRIILLSLWFEEIPWKWSHVKMKHVLAKIDYVFPVHNNDCKDFYKKQILKKIQESELIAELWKTI